MSARSRARQKKEVKIRKIRKISPTKAAEIFFRRRFGPGRIKTDPEYFDDWKHRFIVGTEIALSDNESLKVIRGMQKQGYRW